MNRVKKGLFFLLILEMIHAQSGRCQSQNNPLPSIVHFSSSIIPARYIHDHNTAQIGALRHQHSHFHGMHTPGLTMAEEEMKSDFQMETLHYPGSRVYQVWAKAINVDFSYTKMDVYISSQYGEGTCPYKVIRDHENQHVAINARTLQKYADQMQQALMSCKTFPTKNHPWKVSSVSKARSALKQKILGIVNPLYHRYAQEVIRANAQIDTPENYKRTQALCQDW
jgi:hypothetical protein